MNFKKVAVIFSLLILLIFGYKFYMHYRIASSILDSFDYNDLTFEILQETILGKESEAARVKLVEQTINDADGFETSNKIELNGASTMLPFSESMIQSMETKEQLIEVKTNNGKSFRILHPYIDYISLNFNGLHEDVFEALEEVYGYDAGRIGFFRSNEKLRSAYTLFILKKAFSPVGAVHYLGVFERENLRGFQACHPDVPACAGETVVVEIIFSDGKSSMMFFENFTQEEIDFAILSFTGKTKGWR